METNRNMQRQTLKECIFCNLDTSRIEKENSLALSFKDLYPVTNGHTLVIPKRHIQSFFDLTSEEKKAMLELLESQKAELMKNDKKILGNQLRFILCKGIGKAFISKNVTNENLTQTIKLFT